MAQGTYSLMGALNHWGGIVILTFFEVLSIMESVYCLTQLCGREIYIILCRGQLHVLVLDNGQAYQTSTQPHHIRGY